MEIREQVNGMVEDAQQYVESKFEQARLSTVEKSTNTISTILVWIAISALAFLCILFMSVLAVVIIYEATGSYLISVGSVLAFYLIVLTLVIIFKKQLLFIPIKNKLLGEYLKLYEKDIHE